MSNPLWSMYKNDSLPEDLSSRFPNAVCHDGTNTVYVTTPKDTEGAYIVPEVDPETGEPLSLEQLIVMVGGYLATQTEVPLIASKSQLIQLFSTPHHRLWCAKYDNKDTLEADYKTALGIDSIDKRKSLDDLNAKARADILAYIKSIA